MVVLTVPKYIDNSKADLISVYTTFAGNFLPVENCSLIMTNANVIFNIDYPVLHNTIDLNFNGNYTIYNPNESLNMTLVVPFSPDFKNLESTCLIKIGGTVAPFSFVEYNLYESPWEQYLTHPYGMSGRRKFIVINATFPENDSIDIEFSFNAYIANPSSRDELIIFYDVGTSRAWNGTITEYVEFRVYGTLPDSYLKYNPDWINYNCTVTNIENGKSYAWEWENEFIIIDCVYILYRYYYHRDILKNFIFLIAIAQLIALPIIIMVIVMRKVKRETL